MHFSHIVERHYQIRPLSVSAMRKTDKKQHLRWFAGQAGLNSSTVNCFPASQVAGDQLGQFEGLRNVRDYFNRIFRPFFIRMMLITLSQAAKVIVLREETFIIC